MSLPKRIDELDTAAQASVSLSAGAAVAVVTGGKTIQTTMDQFGALGSFLQSGTGAVARTFQDKDRDMLALDDYATSGNYDTAVAAMGSTKKFALAGGLSIGTSATTLDSFIDSSLNVKGQLAVGGAYYSHVLAAFGAGTNGNPLTATHQVGVYSAVTANANANGVGSFLGGCETGIGTAATAFTLEKAAHFACGAFNKGAGSIITRLWGLSTFDDTAATNNASIARFDDPFTGNWFIHYHANYPSAFAGAMVFGDVSSVPTNVYFRLSGTFAPSSTPHGFYDDMTLTGVVNADSYALRLNPILNKAGSGTHANFVSLLLDAPTVGAGAATLTNATTLKIAGAPSAGSTTKSLWIVSGNIDLGTGTITSNGSVGLTQGSTATVGRSITLVNGLVTAFA